MRVRNNEKKVKTTQISISKIYLPVLIGVSVVIWMFFREFDPKTFDTMRFTPESIFFIMLAFIFIFGRDFGSIWRFRQMTDYALSWRQAFQVHILSEFTSAVTPAAVGGSALIVLFLNKAGIRLGKSTTIMISNLFLDELFFVLVCPVIFMLIPIGEVFHSTSFILISIEYLFWGIYAAMVLWAALLFVLLFVRPDWIPKLFRFIIKTPFLRKWKEKLSHFSEQLLVASEENSRKSFRFWLVAFGTTALSWTSRFLVVNALFMVFIRVSDHLLIYARQILLWILMKITPTPGASGLSEYAFIEYYSDLNLGAGTILVITVIWRFISFYLYLLFGIFIVPTWLKKSFGNKDEGNTEYT